MPHLIYIIFLFALGACVGSFLNVVVWRVPQIEHDDGVGFFALIRGFFKTMHALSEPPSHCPNCNKLLKWYDNLPVIGWVKLGGKCRFCKTPFSIRYPIIEAITGLMFAGYYIAFFIYQIGPCREPSASGAIQPAHLLFAHDWWLYGLDMALLSALLAASLIDADYFIIPIEIPWVIVPIALFTHGYFDYRGGPATVFVSARPAALALGALLGTIISLVLVSYGILPRSFAEGDPLLEVERKELEEQRNAKGTKQTNKTRKKDAKDDAEHHNKTASADDAPDVEREWSAGEIRREIGKEMLFLLPPMALAMLFVILVLRVDSIGHWWNAVAAQRWVGALLGSVLGGLVGGFTVWFTRILGSIGFGKQAMGMGDVDLMVAVGVVMGAGPVVAAFFVAPFFGIAFSIYLLFSTKRHEVPYGPYLSLAAAFVMLFYCPIEAYFAPGLTNLTMILRQAVAGG